MLAARLILASQPVASWELALRQGEDPRVLGEEAFFGFGVDSGTACLVDAAAVGAVDATDDFLLFERLQQETAVLVDLPAADANLVGFVSGPGDGAYPTWIGRTADGTVACFVVDMLATDMR